MTKLDLKGQVAALNAEIEADRKTAGDLFATFDGLRQSAKNEGVDFLTNQEAFDKLDEAGKAFDTARDELAAKEAKRDRLLHLVADELGEVGAKGGPDLERIDAKLTKAFGKAFVESEVYKALKSRAGQGDNVPIGVTDSVKVLDREGLVKTLISIGNNADLSPVNDRLAGVVPMLLAPLSFLDVIATGTTDSDMVEYLEETTYTNAASPTAESADSPESALAFTLRQKAVQEITHWIPATRRSLQDAAFVESWINNRLIDGARRRLLQQVLTGAGTGTDLEGIYTNSSIGSVDRSSASVTMLDGLHKCITTIRVNAFREPDFVGIHPNDYETVVLSRAGAASPTDGGGAYLFGNPVSGGPRTIWGVPALVDANFTSGSPLVGVGSEANLWIRSGIEVNASDSHADYFIKRRVAFLATMRAAFGIITPAAFCKCVA